MPLKISGLFWLADVLAISCLPAGAPAPAACCLALVRMPLVARPTRLE